MHTTVESGKEYSLEATLFWENFLRESNRLMLTSCHLQLEDGPKNLALHDIHLSEALLCIILKLHKFLVKINFGMCVFKNVKCSKKNQIITYIRMLKFTSLIFTKLEQKTRLQKNSKSIMLSSARSNRIINL